MSPRPNSFTLIELLIVVGVVAILSVAVVMALNPTQLMAQGRDATRLNDLDTLNHALSIYNVEKGGSLGTTNVVYVSVPDPAILTTNSTSSCAGIGFSNANLPAGWSYQCVSTSSVQDVDGTGWIPVNFTTMNSKPLSQLPIDPVNTTSSGNYYAYVTNGNQFELTSLAESQKYRFQTNSKTSFQPGLMAQGSNLGLSPIFNSSGLVGYWPMDEGTGSIAYDQSGNGNNGAWSGTQAGDSGTYYTTGKVGKAGYFDGNTDFININNSLNTTGDFTIFAWIKTNSIKTGWNTIFAGSSYDIGFGYQLSAGNAVPWLTSVSNTDAASATSTFPNGTWASVSVTFNNATKLVSYYINGVLVSTTTFNVNFSPTLKMIGKTTNYSSNISALLDEVRVYNRALSASEVQAIYTATK